ncbi:uncharacterized protein LOC131301981 [Rhododendron vialii]|uniref:uncharacterized protein LOC131301981 n=1 Tax=Rhododendron vialii TaxID=182163 RepID=UPI00265EB079|nr:uncharacterized protein LOC131301981 [Rhododendron vialii]XP_058184502.1 uncharacterized protein LOC131301981 [Rhododendron vialii]XP_058184503.1 uncharacterized protein LOC131301981 [Rhododendron vialii]XP_058184504.1 uncharacterized protein LOC131301981 [Rhododendron vialii]XP_058184505.1 uncharacterized protein LOC131301981 [Rhododendron vialii]
MHYKEAWLGSILLLFSFYKNKVVFPTCKVIHMLSVSLNKVGDLKDYDEDLQGARSYYFQSLNVRRDAIKNHPVLHLRYVDGFGSRKGISSAKKYTSSKEICGMRLSRT